MISSNLWPLFCLSFSYIYGFWLHFWYLQTFGHYVVCLSLIFMASDYTFDMFKPLAIILSVFLLYLWLLITLLIFSIHWPLFCLSFSYIYGFWLLHFWYLQTFGHYFVCLSLIFMTSDFYTFDIFKPLAIICLSFSYIYDFRLHFWYLQTFGHYFVCLSLIFMASDYYTFDIFKPLAIILSVFLLYLWLLITTLLISSNLRPLFCLPFSYIYGFWLHFWYLQTFGHYFVCLSLIFMASDNTFDIFKPLAIILSVFLLYLWLLITLLISSNLWPLCCLSFSYIYGFWLHFWYVQTFGHYFVCLSLIFMASDYTFDIFKPLAIILSVFLLYLWLLIATLLISSNHWPLFCLSVSYIYGFWLLHFWYLQTFDHYFVCLSLIFMTSDYYTFDIFKPLAIILSVFLLHLWLLITTLLISSNLWPLFCLSFSYIYDFWFLHFWYLQTIGHYFVCLSLIFMASDYYTFDIFKPLAIILSVFLLYLWLLITLLISSNVWPLFCLSFCYIYGFWLHFWYLQTFGHYVVCLSLIFMASDYTFDIFKPLAIILFVFLCYIYGFWLHFWYLQIFGHYFVCLSLIFMASDYTFDIFKPLAIILSVFLLYLWLLIATLLISSNHWPLFCLSFSYIYGFWLLHFWYLQTFGHYFVCLSLIFMASDYTFDIFKPLVIILSVFLLYLWLLIILLISSNLWPLFCLSFSYIYGFWLLHFWYLQTFGHYFVCLSLMFMTSDYYTFDIFKPLAIILSVILLYLWLLITLLISSNLWPLFCLSFSFIDGFWLHFWYLQVFSHYFVCLSLIFMASDYTFDIFKPLTIILSIFLLYLWLLITTLLISSSLRPLFCLPFSNIYGFWLHFWYHQTFGHYFVCLSLIFMASDYTFDIFKLLAIMLSVFLLYLWLQITILISSNLWPLFCLSFSYIYGFWLLHFWYLQTFDHYFVCLSLIFMASDYYTFDIFKPLAIILSVFLLYLWLLITTLLISSSLRPLFCLPFSNIYGFWLHFWYLQTFGHYFVCLSLIFMASDYTFDIFKPLAIMLSVFLLYLWLLITLLICSNLWPLFCLSFCYIYGFWLHFWYFQSIGHYFVCLSLIFMASDCYTFDIFKPLAIILCVFLLYLWLLITTLLISSNLWPLFCLSFSYIYDFWFLHFWYLQTIGHYLSVFLLYLWLQITLLISSNFWPLFCLSFSYIYGFWLLHFWYLQTFGHYFVCLSLIFMASDYYTFDIFKP